MPDVVAVSPDADGVVGAVFDWPCSTLPGPKYRWADGSVLKRADYSLLFSRYGTQHNTGGEAGDEFRLPNRAGRVPVGQDTAQTEFDTVGENGGSKTSGTASHTHPVTGTPGGAFYSSLTTTTINDPGSGGTLKTVVTGGTTTQPTVGTLATGAPATSGDNLQPYQVTRYIVKVL